MARGAGGPQVVQPAATAAVLVRALHAIDPHYPAADPAVRGEMLRARDELRAELGVEKAGAA